MARVTVEDTLPEIENRFALVLLASSRARQLMRGARPHVQRPGDKETVLALREIAAGKVRFDRPVREVLTIRLKELEQQYAERYGLVEEELPPPAPVTPRLV